VIRGDHRIELAAHRAHEHRIGGKRPEDSARAGGGGKQLVVFGAEPSSVAGVWIQRAQRDSRLGDPVPFDQAGPRDVSGLDDRIGAQLLGHSPERKMRRRQHHAQLV